MRWSARTWTIISVLLFAAAAVIWQLGNRRRDQQPPATPPALTNAAVTNATHFPLLTPTAVTAQKSKEEKLAEQTRRRYPNQLSNTRKHIGQLMRSETAVLLQNALIETAEGTRLPIPAHLKSSGDPGAYIVQSRGPLDNAFRHRLADAGATIISYIPNNAYLVRVSAEGARSLGAWGQTQSVLPYEPYFKLDTNLLAQAVAQKPAPEGQRLKVTGFPGEQARTRAAFQSLGAKVLSEEPTPFGPTFTVEPPDGALIALAQSPLVQLVETWYPRMLLNDLSRRRLNIVTNTDAMTMNHLNLTGMGVTLNLNDTGADFSHPDLTGRLSTDPTLPNLPIPLLTIAMTDPDGHGTHVAGTIMSSGASSPMNMITTNGATIPGSASNANFRGMAPGASLYVLPIFLNTGAIQGDSFLQTNAAAHNYGTNAGALGRTNALVSNNSWGYPAVNFYDTASASYDAAVRDALLESSGMQPLIYVFAAGNSGFGADDGTGAIPDTIGSPATGKNVITVGAIESVRNITNVAIFSNAGGILTTSQVFYTTTDSSNQVASFSSRGNVGIGIEGPYGRFKPDVMANGTFTVSTRSKLWDLTNTFPVNSPFYPPLNVLNTALAPDYRYETGTSMAAPAVSGTIALMQEFFETRLMQGYSPALIKALLINGASPVNSVLYDYQTTNAPNDQGWGVVNITNSIPSNLVTASASPLIFLDQGVTNALATGESQSYILTVPPGSSNQAPLRITLVWTDPPGNPAAALKLVNDLDLVVEEIDSATLQTNAVYVGNSFQPRTSFVDPFPPPTPGTNTLPAPDRVNNVENVYINTPLNDQYRITVKGSRVNVNAVTAHTNNTVQDYALVISVARPSLTTALTVTTVVNPFELLPTQELTNGIPAALQRAGANTPLIGGTNGLTNQWSFYVFTNLLSSNNPAGLTNGTNVAIVTFRSPNLSLPRNREADLDLFVSLNSLITNLDPVVLASPATQRSVGRGGTEAVVVTNAMLGDVYYIAVKSEDQQAAQFNLLAISTDQPFARLDTNGNMILTGVPLGPIPDGDANFPGVATPVLCINNLQSHVLLRAVITNTITHQLLGDVFSSLEFDLQEVVLHPHDLVGDTNSGTIRFIYDDSGQGNIPGSQHTGDGVASLNDFVGMETYLMPFIATFTDNATNHIGSVDQFDMLLERIPDTNNVGRVISLGPSACLFAFIDVPVNATNLIVELSQLTGSLDVFLRRGLPPTMTVFDKMARIFPPGGTLSCNVFSSPPLIVPGRYFIMICNPNPFTVTGFLRFILEYGLTPNNQLTFVATNGPIPLVDDALIYSSILVTNTNSAARIVDVRVGVRADHPRASDLVFHLISPQGTRILLFEERGLDVSTNLGFDFGPMPTNPTPQMLLTNFSWVTFAESTNLAPLPVKFAVPPFQNPNTNPIIFDFTNSFEQPIFGPSIIATNVQGTVFDGWLVETNYVAVIIDTNIALQGSNFLALSHGRVSHPLVTTNDIDYVLNFSYRKVSSATTQLVNVAVPATANMGFYTNSLMSNTLPVAVPKMRLCPGQQCVVTATNCTTSDGINCLGPEGFPISTNINGLPLYGLVGQWCRSAKVFDTNTTWNPPFYIGTNAVLTAPLDPGDYYLFLAENDFDYTDNSGAFTVNVEWQPCQLARFDWDLGGVTNTLFAEEYWKTNSLLFTANPLTTNLGFQSNWNFTVLIDKIELFRPISTIYYQPEEPLALLQNELGVGRWRLEVWDKRVGALPGATNNGQLLSWYLQIQFAPERPATRLTNCVPYSDFVLPNDTRYFVVEVPFEATEATNIFAGPGALDLLYRRDALPTGLGFGPNADPVAYPLPNPFIIFTISPLGAPLIPGGQYFLGVRNTSMTVTNPFTLTVSMNLNLIPLPNNIFTATNGVTNVISSNLNSMPPVTNIVTPGTNMHWYKYTPFADTNSQGVAFDLFSTNGEVRLVAKRAAPVVNYLPTPTNFDYQSVRFTLNSNRITVLTNSFPVRMEPELWLLGVYNVGTNDAAYRLRAYQFTNSMPPNYPAPAPYVSARLSNDTAIPFELLPNNVTNIMMPFSNAIIPRAVIDQTNSAVIFEICNILPMGADVDLLVRRSDHPSHSLYDFADFTQGTSDKFVVLKTNIYIPQLNATNWFLTLINNEPFTVRGTIRFMVATNGFVTNCFGMTNLAPSFIGSGGPFKFSFYTIPGAKYEVQATTDLTSWTPVSTFTATHTTTKFVDPVPGNPNQHRFYRVVRLSP